MFVKENMFSVGRWLPIKLFSYKYYLFIFYNSCYIKLGEIGNNKRTYGGGTMSNYYPTDKLFNTRSDIS